MIETLFFIALPLLLITDGVGIYLIKNTEPKLYEKLGQPSHWWTGSDKIAYLLSFILWFKYVNCTNQKTRLTLAIQSVSLWYCLIYVLNTLLARL